MTEEDAEGLAEQETRQAVKRCALRGKQCIRMFPLHIVVFLRPEANRGRGMPSTYKQQHR